METLDVFDLYRNVFDLYEQKYVLWHNNIIFRLKDLERTCLLRKTSVNNNLVTYKTHSILNVIT